MGDEIYILRVTEEELEEDCCGGGGRRQGKESQEEFRSGRSVKVELKES